MHATPDDLKYTDTHEWVRREEDGTLTIGITDHAQSQLGDVVFVDIPRSGREFLEGNSCAVVESVKAASDIYAPVAGVVTAANEALRDDPELINNDPYGDGWIWKMRPNNAADVDQLMDAAAYAAKTN